MHDFEGYVFLKSTVDQYLRIHMWFELHGRNQQYTFRQNLAEIVRFIQSLCPYLAFWKACIRTFDALHVSIDNRLVRTRLICKTCSVTNEKCINARPTVQGSISSQL